jgi:hypothetical protein
MSVKDMIKKEATASEKAEAEWNKKHLAHLSKPKPVQEKPKWRGQQQQQQHQQRQHQNRRGQKRKRGRGRGRGRGWGHQQTPRVRLNQNSLAPPKPPANVNAGTSPYVKTQLAKKICYGCGLTGHIKSNCPSNP